MENPKHDRSEITSTASVDSIEEVSSLKEPENKIKWYRRLLEATTCFTRVSRSQKTLMRLREEIANRSNQNEEEIGMLQQLVSTIILFRTYHMMSAEKEHKDDVKQKLFKNIVTINVGGTTFQTFFGTIMRYRGTRLAEEVKNPSLMKLRYHVNNLGHRSVRKEYYFDRDPIAFAHVLNFYRTDHLHIPYGTCGPSFKTELDYWEISPNLVQPCCRELFSKYTEAYQSLEILRTQAEPGEEAILQHRRTLVKVKKIKKLNIFERCLKQMKYHWIEIDIIDKSKTLGQIYHAFLVTMLTYNVLLLALESLYLGRKLKLPSDNSSQTDSQFWIYESYGTFYLQTSYPTKTVRAFRFVEVLFSTLEIAYRFGFCPCKVLYLSHFFNWTDIMAWWGSFLTCFNENNLDVEHYMRMLRCLRIFTIFRLPSKIGDTHLLWMVFREGLAELLSICLMAAMCIMALGVVFYCAENFVNYKSSKGPKSMIHSYWWALVTVTSCGYGDVSPNSEMGYLFAALTAVMGIIIVSLPIPLVVNSFTLYYSQLKLVNNSNMEADERRRSSIFNHSQ